MGKTNRRKTGSENKTSSVPSTLPPLPSQIESRGEVATLENTTQAEMPAAPAAIPEMVVGRSTSYSLIVVLAKRF